MNAKLYEKQRLQILEQPIFNWPGLGAWSLYFILKLALAYQGALNINLLYNLALFLLIIFPIKPRFIAITRQLLVVFLAISLIYYESNLPPFNRLIAQWDMVSSFSLGYLLELLFRLVPTRALIALLVSWVIYLYVSKVVRVTMVTFIALITSPIWLTHQNILQQIQSDTNISRSEVQNNELKNEKNDQVFDPDQYLTDFYTAQKSLKLQTPQIQTDFDILILNICSLSWSDLKNFNLTEHPVLNQADIVFSNYYSGSSYSGPAALRLLQAHCGHVPHSDLFQPEEQCKIGTQLAELGFATEVRLNHTGAFDNFLTEITQLSGLDQGKIMAVDDFPVIMDGFDQTPIYSDRAILMDWLDQPNDQPTYTFYNTTTLHDGNQMKGFIGNSRGSYKQRLETLLDDIYHVFDEIEKSKRKVLVILVPEHGAGLEGDRFQLPGMREIPTPALTHVPVFIKLFGVDEVNRPDTTVYVDKYTSPLAITELIYQTINQQPFSGGYYNPSDIAKRLPSTPPVIENERVIMLENNSQFYLKIGSDDWRAYND